MDEPREQVERRSIGDSFAGFCAAVVRRLPFGLASVVAPSLVGFGLINGFTFGVDLALLTLLRTGLGWPVWAAISVSYLTAFGLSFVLNRWLNFRSHAPAGRQTGLYLVTITINYLAILLGVGGGLATLGVQYHLSRIIAGVCEGAFMYCALRWVVFADRRFVAGRQHPGTTGAHLEVGITVGSNSPRRGRSSSPTRTPSSPRRSVPCRRRSTSRSSR